MSSRGIWSSYCYMVYLVEWSYMVYLVILSKRSGFPNTNEHDWDREYHNTKRFGTKRSHHTYIIVIWRTKSMSFESLWFIRDQNAGNVAKLPSQALRGPTVPTYNKLPTVCGGSEIVYNENFIDSSIIKVYYLDIKYKERI